MKRWLPWLVLPLVCVVQLVVTHPTSAAMLRDSDTAVLLANLRARHDPLSWFGGDWPLANHFYRPVSTLAFEFDNWAHGDDAGGYGLTQSLIGAACVLLVFWLVRELTDKPWAAGVSSLLFGAWHLNWPVSDWLSLAALVGAVVVWVAPFRHGWRRVGPTLMGSAALFFLAGHTWPPVSFASRTVAWLPGRTATVMTVFCLVATAAYARFERLRAARLPLPEATAEDEPVASRTTFVAKARATDGLWLAVAVLATALALASYEQAVMLPAAIFGVAVLVRSQGRRPHWWAHAVFWAVLLGYVVLRKKLVPSDVSGYQAQQFRNGPGVAISILDFAFPAHGATSLFLSQLQDDWLIFLTGTPFVYLFQTHGNVGLVVRSAMSREKWTLAFAWLCALLTFLPMAWLKEFAHYYYWPSVYWALLVTGLTVLGGQIVVSALSHPAVQAPPRPSPAPGSLPRLSG
ncbi:MAG: hypothetical protein KF857_01340 [Fimbriimonadaceae bacterium]|nr:hypothetical protein [Fimbriimonadaceae bacterium]